MLLVILFFKLIFRVLLPAP